MRLRLPALTAAFVAACCANAAAGDLPDTSAPAGIRATTIALAAVLAGNRRAEGTLAAGMARTRTAQWKLVYGALNGTRAENRDGADYRVDETLGPTRTARGRNGSTIWHMDANGQVLVESGIHRADDVDRAALRTPQRESVTLLGTVDDPVAAYVVKVDPPGGRLEYLFFDRATYLTDRIEELRDGRRYAISFDGYRTTKGLTEPWHVHTSDGIDGNDEDESLQSLALGDAIAAGDLAVPTASATLFVAPAPSVSIPVVMDFDRIVVPVKMGGHTVNFLLDSGAEAIAIDKDVVEALKIPEHGRVTGETAGAYVASDVVLPSMTLGTLTLTNVHAVSLPFVQMTESGKPIAGLLGYDFIRSAVLHVDYQHGTLEAIPPESFVPPAGAHAFPLTLDDGVPTIAATIGGAAAPAFIVDTGADRSAIFSAFANAHPRELADHGLGAAMQAAFPFVDKFSGVGGTVEYHTLQAGPFLLGPWTFPKWIFTVTQNAPSFEFEDYDGLLGQDVLRNFDLYLDYAHGKLFLLPNDRFKQRWPI